MILSEFINIFDQDIAPQYLRNEQAFDSQSHHGRLHILRCLYLAEYLCSSYEELGYDKIDRTKVFFPIAFHDIGRKGNDIDLWEEDSYKICLNYLVDSGLDQTPSEKIASSILKKEPFDPITQILYDVDVLDYMRFFTYDMYARSLFQDARLKYFSKDDIIISHPKTSDQLRETAIQLALQFAIKTENLSLSHNHNVISNKISQSWMQIVNPIKLPE